MHKQELLTPHGRYPLPDCYSVRFCLITRTWKPLQTTVYLLVQMIPANTLACQAKFAAESVDEYLLLHMLEIIQLFDPVRSTESYPLSRDCDPSRHSTPSPAGPPRPTYEPVL